MAYEQYGDTYGLHPNSLWSKKHVYTTKYPYEEESAAKKI